MTDVKIKLDKIDYWRNIKFQFEEKTLYLRSRLTENIDGSVLLSRTLMRDYGLISSLFSYLQYSSANILLVCIGLLIRESNVE